MFDHSRRKIIQAHGQCFYLLSHLAVPTSEQGSLRTLGKVAFCSVYRSLVSHLSIPCEYLEGYGTRAFPVTSQLPKVALAVPRDDQIFQVWKAESSPASGATLPSVIPRSLLQQVLTNPPLSLGWTWHLASCWPHEEQAVQHASSFRVHILWSPLFLSQPWQVNEFTNKHLMAVSFVMLVWADFRSREYQVQCSGLCPFHAQAGPTTDAFKIYRFSLCDIDHTTHSSRHFLAVFVGGNDSDRNQSDSASEASS